MEPSRILSERTGTLTVTPGASVVEVVDVEVEVLVLLLELVVDELEVEVDVELEVDDEVVLDVEVEVTVDVEVDDTVLVEVEVEVEVEPAMLVDVVTLQFAKLIVQLPRQTRKAPPAEPPGQVWPPKSVPSHSSPPSRTPLPQTGGALVVVVVLVLVVVVAPLQPGDGTLSGSAGSVRQSSSVRSNAPSRSRSMPARVPAPGGTQLKVSSWPAVLANPSIVASDTLGSLLRSGRKLPPPM
jgi:hypothetical protein